MAVDKKEAISAPYTTYRQTQTGTTVPLRIIQSVSRMIWAFFNVSGALSAFLEYLQDPRGAFLSASWLKKLGISSVFS